MSLGEEMRTWKPSTVLTFWGMVIGTWAGVSLTLGVRVWSWATGTPAPPCGFGGWGLYWKPKPCCPGAFQ